VRTPDDPGEGGALIKGPSLVKVDRYGSVSGLLAVRTPLGLLVVRPAQQAPLDLEGVSDDLV